MKTIAEFVPFLLTMSVNVWNWVGNIPWDEWSKPAAFFLIIITCFYYLQKIIKGFRKGRNGEL